ncbi:MAG: type II toxin-antitoxin system RelE/ParE family toxin [Deinococcota bacterium]|nr:type II toxin-antitoxin system RelE/ParE family toxin [Deinococcota bacterium]
MPQHWTVKDYEDEDGTDPVADFILSLTPAERGRVATRLQILRQEGLNARTEYIHKVRGKLWELRFPKSQNNPRILFCAVIGRRIILLHGFAKTGKATDKIPEREIATAERRMEAFLEREG